MALRWDDVPRFQDPPADRIRGPLPEDSRRGPRPGRPHQEATRARSSTPIARLAAEVPAIPRLAAAHHRLGGSSSERGTALRRRSDRGPRNHDQDGLPRRPQCREGMPGRIVRPMPVACHDRQRFSISGLFATRGETDKYRVASMAAERDRDGPLLDMPVLSATTRERPTPR